MVVLIPLPSLCSNQAIVGEGCDYNSAATWLSPATCKLATSTIRHFHSLEHLRIQENVKMSNPPPMNIIDPVPMASPSQPAIPGALPPDSSPQAPTEYRPVYGPPNRPPQEEYQPLPVTENNESKYGPVNTTFAPPPLDVRVIQTNCQVNLLELISLQGKASAVGMSREMESSLRTQSALVLDDLRALQLEVKERIKVAENHRWRRWLVGGGV